MRRASIEPQRDGLEERDVLCEDLLVRKVEAVAYQLVDVVVREQVEDGRPRVNVLDEDRERLQQLHLDTHGRLRLQEDGQGWVCVCERVGKGSRGVCVCERERE